MKRPNLTVVTGALVKKLRLEGRRVLGVEFEQGGEAFFAGARRETILAAGAIGSPQILQLSGIGPGALLQKHGIPVAHELPVGENLQDHLQLRMAFKVKNAVTLNTLLHSWWGKAKIGLEYLLFRTGPMTMPPSQLGAFDLGQVFLALGQERSRAIAGGWSGGAVRHWHDGDADAVALRVRFGEADVAADACDATPLWYAEVADGEGAGERTMQGDRDWLSWTCAEHELRVGLGPDEATAVALGRD